MDGHHDGLVILEGVTEDACVFRAVGTIDIVTASTVAAALDGSWDKASTLPVIVDMAGVDFLDSAGLGALLMARLRAERMGRDFRLCSPQPSVERLLRVVGLDHLLVDGI